MRLGHLSMAVCQVSRVVIVPGNGAGHVTRANWYGWMQRETAK
jgi:hypothetical protein